MAQEPETLVQTLEEIPEYRSDTTFVSHLNDSDRPLKIGDRVRYIGNFQPTFEACVGEPLEVLGFAEGAICASQQCFAIACSTSTGKLIWIYPEDLERIS